MWEVAAVAIAGVVLPLLGFVAKQVSSINDEFKILNGRFYNHLNEPGNHREGLAIIRGEVDAVDQKAVAAHKRIDVVCAKQGGRT